MAKGKKKETIAKEIREDCHPWTSDLVVPNIILFPFPKPRAPFKREY